MTIPLKIGIATTLGATAICGSVGLAYFLSPTKNLKEELENDSNFKALNTTSNVDDTSWQKLAEKHAKSPADSGVLKIVGLDIQTPTASTTPHLGIAKLKEKCELLFKKTKKEKDYEQAKKDVKNWCNKNSSLLSQ